MSSTACSNGRSDHTPPRCESTIPLLVAFNSHKLVPGVVQDVVVATLVYLWFRDERVG
jgi:hypothetical protein